MRIASFAMCSPVNSNSGITRHNSVNYTKNISYQNYASDTVSFGRERKLPKDIRKNFQDDEQTLDYLNKIYNLKNTKDEYLYQDYNIRVLMREKPDKIKSFYELASLKDEQSGEQLLEESPYLFLDTYDKHKNAIADLLRLKKIFRN